MLFVVITTHNTVWAQRIFVLKQVGAHSNHWLWLLCAPPGLTPEILRSAHTVYLCVVWIWEQTAIISLLSIISPLFLMAINFDLYLEWNESLHLDTANAQSVPKFHAVSHAALHTLSKFRHKAALETHNSALKLN